MERQGKGKIWLNSTLSNAIENICIAIWSNFKINNNNVTSKLCTHMKNSWESTKQRAYNTSLMMD
jgi:hypothetical protein